ncbi:MAG: S9 family peptidase [Alphaproteobacteria bacterium]|nr:S9 family peptidase [Alphaproteobacteria bacterium]
MTKARYGEWASPITARAALGVARAIADVEIDNGVIWLSELRPDEGGRSQIVRIRPDGVAEDVLPEGMSARTRVHEYGGGAILPDMGAVYFVNDRDQRIWRDVAGGTPRPVTPEGKARFTDMAARDDMLIAVREDHSEPGEPVNDLARVDLKTGAVTTLWRGSDFVAHPRVSPGGLSLAWVAWDHPNMPWDATTLHVGRFGPDGDLAHVYQVASAKDGYSVIQPAWADDGTLYYLSDEPGDWSLYRWRNGATELVAHLDGEIGSPAWQFRQSDFALINGRQAIATLTRHGCDSLVSIDLVTGTARPIATPFTAIREISADGATVVVHAASPESGAALYRVTARGVATEIYRPKGPAIAASFAARPRPLSFATSGGATAHAFYYPPLNPDYTGEGTPPLIVTAHGGPTGVSKPQLAVWRTYWTSRGFAVLDVNYRGSTGFGRAYRKALNGLWGDVDIADVVAGAHYCAGNGLADGARMAVYGGSAGGYVVLAALAFYPDVFKAGVNLFGISDLEALAADTHKFEARYTDTLIGPLPAAKDIYRARSPLFAADRIRAPLLTLQGLDDKAVPPAQSSAIYEAVKAKGVPTAYLPFEGEGHGFRKAENQIRTLTATHYFLAKMFGLTPPETLEPIAIDNL